MIFFSAIEADACRQAHDWHVDFAAADDALFPRSSEDFQSLVMDGCVWAARSTDDDILGMAYTSYNETEKVCELGGVMVSETARGKGIGQTIMRLALGHAIVEENLLTAGAQFVAHVVEGNLRPVKALEALKFEFCGPVNYDAAALPGLRSRDGRVYGSEYVLNVPEALESLSAWAKDWHSQLGESFARIELRNRVSLRDWANVFDAIRQENR